MRLPGNTRLFSLNWGKKVRVPGFTRKIWELFGSTAEKRADYLWKLYLRTGTMRCNGDYLDIGCASGQNAIAFGQDCQRIHCLDIDNENVMECRATFRLKSISNVSFYQGDAQALPFKDSTFDLISMFSVIEHIPEQHLAIQEASRVLKPGGQIILQVPNKYFFVDLHTGIPFLHCLPLKTRRWLLTKLWYRQVSDVAGIRVLSRGELTNLIQTKFAKVHVLKVIYPSELIMPQLKPVYFAFNLFGLFKLVPFGFLFVADKATDGSASLNRKSK